MGKNAKKNLDDSEKEEETLASFGTDGMSSAVKNFQLPSPSGRTKYFVCSEGPDINQRHSRIKPSSCAQNKRCRLTNFHSSH